jgi:hypothetical protein
VLRHNIYRSTTIQAYRKSSVCCCHILFLFFISVSSTLFCYTLVTKIRNEQNIQRLPQPSLPLHNYINCAVFRYTFLLKTYYKCNIQSPPSYSGRIRKYLLSYCKYKSNITLQSLYTRVHGTSVGYVTVSKR